MDLGQAGHVLGGWNDDSWSVNWKNDPVRPWVHCCVHWLDDFRLESSSFSSLILPLEINSHCSATRWVTDLIYLAFSRPLLSHSLVEPSTSGRHDNQHPMGNHQLNALDMDGRAAYLWAHGDYLTGAIDEQGRSNFYSLHGYFVEVELFDEGDGIMAVIPFTTGVRYERLLSVIDLARIS